MGKLLVISLVTWAGCFFDSGGTKGSDFDGSIPDATAFDADPNAPDADPCGWPAEHFDACAIIPPNGGLSLDGGAYVYDTDLPGFTVNPSSEPDPATEIIGQANQDARLISVTTLDIKTGSSLRVVGSLPLIVAARDAIEINGPLDVSSSAANGTGAGANAVLCEALKAGVGIDGAGGASGGGGGGFGARGGDGGVGDDNGAILAGGAGGGTATQPDIVRGGCAGAAGGNGGDPGGAGGDGGGAIQLTSQFRIRIRMGGTVHAGGGGGIAGTFDSGAGGRGGGGGGGSGGYIGLDAPSVRIEDGGTLATNGGGGGEGAEAGGTPALSGVAATPDDQQASGGTGGTPSGGDGAAGGAGDTEIGGTGQTSPGGGGGGGGAVGYVLVWTSDYREEGTFIVSPNSIVTMKP